MKREFRLATLHVEDDHWWYRGRRRVIAAALGRLSLPNGAEILDVGTGGGGNLPLLGSFGDVTAIDIDDEALAAARRRGVGTLVKGRAEHLPFEAGSFDLVTILDVLEHIDDDVAALAELRRVVRRGGYALVTVPAYQCLYGPHDVLNEHRRRYVRDGLLGVATRSGWATVATSYFNSFTLPAAVAVRLVEKRRGSSTETSDLERTPAWLNRLLEMPMRAEARILAGGGSLPAGLSLLAAFRAPA